MIQSIHAYRAEVEKIIHFGGTAKETAIRSAFFNLLNDYARQQGLIVVAELSLKTSGGKIVKPDGTLKDSLRQDWGYWESKDEADNLDEEIEKKFAKGYPKDNILFEDSREAVLIQNGEQVMRCPVSDDEALHSLLMEFITFERPEVQNFRKAIEMFGQDVPKVTDALRSLISDAEINNKGFKLLVDNFLTLCRESINTSVTGDDVREMIIQHILTEDIFNRIFGEMQFHRENNIARELEKVIATFFTGSLRQETMRSIRHYYDAINAAAACIADHHEKQKFLKVVYETFYKSYNPKAADRLGVVYTPNEIVRFMIESTDYLLNRHFDKYLKDENVEILDPATGTGTFICDLIDYIGKNRIRDKYRNEIHANEVAILPYYISNLNIEYTYAQKMNEYAEFENLCFTDTLDNTGFNYAGKQGKLFSEENSRRIKNQNSKKISVIIGNPPYNANQANENDNNKNREYPEIDRRISDTFIKYSTAQKTKVYDMYARFLRWAMDRIDENGIIAFVSNNSFIDSKTFDGFRKVLSREFSCAYVINLKGNARTSGERRRQEGGNVFHDKIRVGVAIYFLIKKKSQEKFHVYYDEVEDYAKDDEKLHWLSSLKIKDMIENKFEYIRPDKNSNWINIPDNDFESLLPLCKKNVKSGRCKEALFELYSLGVVTARDEWVYDYDKANLSKKVNFLIDIYNKNLALHKGKDKKEIATLIDYSIKWSRALKNDLAKGKKHKFNKIHIIDSLYRPFVKKKLYFSKELNEMRYQMPLLFPDGKPSNVLIGFLQGKRQPFAVFSTNIVSNYAMFSGDYAQCLPLYRYDNNGNRIENITDWGLQQFAKHYNDNVKHYNDNGACPIVKQDIFHYVYAVLHNPTYRKKYEQNLKREFPRIPYYDDFHKWANWGEKLMNMHINYETAEPFQLRIMNYELREGAVPKPKLKADKKEGIIYLDEQTELHGIPAEAWQYKLGNRSALEWILDQYQERKLTDPTIAGQFDVYRFAGYKEQVTDLLKRVCTVSVETVKILEEMENL